MHAKAFRLATLTALASLGLAGCATPPGVISPRRAVMRAAAAVPQGVRGTFQLTVRATGHQDGTLYLNSELDYRDQRTLTIAVPEAVEKMLDARFGRLAESYLIGKTIRVQGIARRIKIGFFANGVATDKYYYQTHVAVRVPEQIDVRR